jgi:hypothetical protein
VTVNQGADQTLSFHPSTGYQVADAKVDGISVGGITSYAFNNVAANHFIQASFTALPPVERTTPTEILRFNFDGGKREHCVGYLREQCSWNDLRSRLYGIQPIGPFALAFDGINDYVIVNGNGDLEPIKSSSFSFSPSGSNTERTGNRVMERY